MKHRKSIEKRNRTEKYKKERGNDALKVEWMTQIPWNCRCFTITGVTAALLYPQEENQRGMKKEIQEERERERERGRKLNNTARVTKE